VNFNKFNHLFNAKLLFSDVAIGEAFLIGEIVPSKLRSLS